MTDLTNSFATIRRSLPDGAWMAVIAILAGLAIIDPGQWLPNVQFALSALANTASMRAVAAMLMSMIGRRPQASDRLPQTGAKKNCATLYMPISAMARVSVAP